MFSQVRVCDSDVNGGVGGMLSRATLQSIDVFVGVFSQVRVCGLDVDVGGMLSRVTLWGTDVFVGVSSQVRVCDLDVDVGLNKGMSSWVSSEGGTFLVSSLDKPKEDNTLDIVRL